MEFAPTRWLSRTLLRVFGGRGLRRLIRAHDPDVIVSTYPGVTCVLGELRRRGKLSVPCYSSITDLAGLHFWAHPGIDLHFITHPESAEEVEKVAGPGSVRWAKPPTSSSFLAFRERADARRALGLPAQGTVIAVSGGGWGVGDLAGATSAALDVPDATVLCLCGRNDKLRAKVAARFGSEPRLRVMGFTDRMGDVLAASDALIHSSAGLTVLEAIIRGCPVISYGFGYGHVRASNAALERFGLAQVARTQADIHPALERALESRPAPDGSFARRPATASLILSDERRARTLPRWRIRTARAATTLAATIGVSLWGLSTGASYQFVSHFVHMRPMTAVQTSRPEVGVLVDTPAGQLPVLAGALAERGIHVSLGVDRAPSAAAQLDFRHMGDQVVPRLDGGGLVRWIGTRGTLERLSDRMGYGRHFLYASSGPSIGQWLVAHGAGGRFVGGAVKLRDLDDSVGHLHAGEVVELTVSDAAALVSMLDKVGARLQSQHLRAVPVGRLFSDAGVET
jgi:UDP-N-acetylglucosamine:LPS N-acetylglucosamine transferase